MARPSNKAQRRAQIIDGLASILAEVGYERATISAIAQAAGLTPGLVHYHFGAKRDVLVSLVEHIIAVARRRYERRLKAAGDDPWRCLYAAIDALVALDHDADLRAAACWIQIGSEATRIIEVAGPYRGAVEMQHRVLAEHCTAIRRAQGRSPDDADVVAAGIMAAIEGAFRLAASAPQIVAWGHTADLVRRMARGLLEGPR